MKRTLSVLLALAFGIAAFGQKPAMDHDVYDSWQRVGGVELSADGTFLTWSVVPQEGDGTLFIKRTTDGKVLEIPRAAGLKMSPAGDWAYCSIKPEFQATRKAKIEKKKKDQMPKDSLGIINLKDLTIKKIAKVTEFKVGFDAMPFVAYTADKKTIVTNAAGDWADTLKNVDSYTFSRGGNALAVVFKKEKKDSLSRNEIVLYDLDAKKRTSLHQDAKFYGSASFSKAGDALVFLTSSDTINTERGGDRHCAIMLAKGGVATELIPASYEKEGLVFNQNAAPYFSLSGNRIFAGLAEYDAPKDSTIVDFETARLDIWNWDALLTPPMQKANKARLEKYTNPAVIDLATKNVSLLSTSYMERVSHFDGGDAPYALAVDRTPYQLSSYWDSNPYNDAYVVNLSDGSRRRILEKVAGTPRLSPAGKYAYWYDCDDLQWYTYDLATDKTVCLTADCRTNFYDEEDDHPHYPGPYDYSPTWTANDEYILISDRYDVWKFAANGSAIECLTDGEGRDNNVRFRILDPVKRMVYPGDYKLGVGYVPTVDSPLYFTTYDEGTKENGLASIKTVSRATPDWFKDAWSFGTVVKAEKAAVLAYTKGNFRNPADLYLYAPKASKKGYPAAFGQPLAKTLAAAKKLTAINPQQANYRWGDVQLVHWQAYDGTPLDGMLFVPEGIKEGEKLPLMIYFYEKYSETLYSYRQPAPSRSTVNVPMYVSNGYVVFIPDIVYTPGHPGESAYNCICSGAEAMCEQFSFIDREHMAIQGQSWGGYQTAYLVTRTDMFCAAGAGAPVGNMTSAYGGIRWESGVARAMQYEHGQSRIGKSLWDEGGLELYVENSPIFFVDKVTTPVLIMHNDADGAVPWYQGIEFFSNLRRFGKPSWLLEYNDEAHNLKERRNCKDLSRRLQQFFDHYMKGAPMPAWMSTGVPTAKKSKYFGFEAAE